MADNQEVEQTITLEHSDTARRKLRKKRFREVSPTKSPVTKYAEKLTPVADLELRDNQALDALFENQRGWFVFGFPLFTANSLVPGVDPGPWTTKDGRAVYGDAASYMLPDETWKWKWNRWFVDMSSDVDDQGWSYGVMFRSKSWHGSHMWARSFVRRRRWLRLREKVEQRLLMDLQGLTELPINLDIDEEDDVCGEGDRLGTVKEKKVDDLIESMKGARIDRERTNLFITFVSEIKEDLEVDALLDDLEKVLDCYEFGESRGHLSQRLESLAGEKESREKEILESIIKQISLKGE